MTQQGDATPDEVGTMAEGAAMTQTRTPLFEAQNAPRYQRQAIIKQIQEHTKRWLICYVSGNKGGIDRGDVVPFADLLHNVPPGKSVDLLLHTLGGSADDAEKLIRMVRGKVGDATLRIIVPDFAMSAGTLMVLGADHVVMSDASALGPIDPQIELIDSNGNRTWQSVQNYLDAYDEYINALTEDPENVAAKIMLGKLDPVTVALCRAAKDRALQSAESQLRSGMFRSGGNWTQTARELLDTKRWRSHSQMISWEDAQDPQLGLHVEYLKPQSEDWQGYWQLYCLQRLAVGDRQKLFESDYASQVAGSTDD